MPALFNIRQAGIIAVLLVAALLPASLFAQEESDLPPPIQPVGFELMEITVFGVHGRLIFNEIYPLDEAGFAPFLELGGGRYPISLFREDNGEEWVPPLENPDPFPGNYQVTDIKLGAGILARILNRYRGLNLNAFGAYRFEYSKAIDGAYEHSIAYDNGLNELSGLFRHSMVLGINFHDIDIDQINQSRQGYAFEFSLTGGHAAVPDFGDAGLWGKISAHTEGYLRLADFSFLGAYLAGRLAGDWVSGSFIPTIEMQKMGGYDQVPLLGGGIRGTLAGRFDGYFRAMTNLDLRVSFPSLFGYNIFPGLFAFADLGVSDCRTDNIFASGLQKSIGGGLWMHIVYVDFLLFYTYHLNEERAGFGFSFGMPY